MKTLKMPSWSPKWEMITPEKAKEYLTKNKHNRSESAAVNNSYAIDIMNNNWIPNHQGIAFNSDGWLIDGQGRLKAIMESGRTVPMLVSHGLQDVKRNGVVVHVMDTVDRGRARTAGQQLSLFHGYSNGNRVAALVTALVDFVGDVKWRRLTVPQMLHVLEIYGKSYEAIYGITDANKRMPAYIGGPIIALHFIEPQAAFNFAVRYISIENLEATSPVLALIRWIEKNKTRHTDTFRALAIKTTATCLYHFKHNNPVKKAAVSDDAVAWVRNQQKANVRKIREILNLK